MEEDTWNKITDLRANGSLSHFLSYFSVMEPSSPFLYKMIKIDKMEVIKTDIEGVLIIEPRLFRDARGYFFENFSEREFKEKVEPLVGYKVEFCQDNESMSSYGVMREEQSDNFYHPEADGGISILDESLGIDWRIPTEHANLSEKDTKHEVLKDFESPFEY